MNCTSTAIVGTARTGYQRKTRFSIAVATKLNGTTIAASHPTCRGAPPISITMITSTCTKETISTGVINCPITSFQGGSGSVLSTSMRSMSPRKSKVSRGSMKIVIAGMKKSATDVPLPLPCEYMKPGPMPKSTKIAKNVSTPRRFRNSASVCRHASGPIPAHCGGSPSPNRALPPPLRPATTPPLRIRCKRA